MNRSIVKGISLDHTHLASHGEHLLPGMPAMPHALAMRASWLQAAYMPQRCSKQGLKGREKALALKTSIL